MNVSLQSAENADLSQVEELVRSYHEFESISPYRGGIREAILPLLGESEFGRVWLIRANDDVAGYVAICFGYSIEMGGRDAFIDEMCLSKPYRGKGIGTRVLRLLQSEAKELGVVALHLEVSKSNERAQRLYRKSGFTGREQYFLMSTRTGRADA